MNWHAHYTHIFLLWFFLVVFNRKHVLQRVLKKRFFKANRLPKLRYGTVGIYCLYNFRFEYKYCLFFRKFFKKLFYRRKRKITTFYKLRTWLFIRPNYALTHKSKNARMGKGKGNFKRWCTIVYAGRVFIEHLNMSPSIYKRYLRKMRVKMKLNFKFIKVHGRSLKRPNLSNGASPTATAFELVRTHRCMYNNSMFSV